MPSPGEGMLLPLASLPPGEGKLILPLPVSPSPLLPLSFLSGRGLGQVQSRMGAPEQNLAGASSSEQLANCPDRDRECAAAITTEWEAREKAVWVHLRGCSYRHRVMTNQVLLTRHRFILSERCSASEKTGKAQPLWGVLGRARGAPGKSVLSRMDTFSISYLSISKISWLLLSLVSDCS